MTRREDLKKEREQKKHKRFINSIVLEIKLNCKKTYEQTGSKTSRLPFKKEKWKQIRSNLEEINSILEPRIRIETDSPGLRLYEIRIIKLD